MSVQTAGLVVKILKLSRHVIPCQVAILGATSFTFFSFIFIFFFMTTMFINVILFLGTNFLSYLSIQMERTLIN